MLKILHLFSDGKFIDLQLPRYQQDFIDNTAVYLEEEFNYKGNNIENIKFIKPSSIEYEALVNEAINFDIIIVYLLDSYKAKFINNLNPRIKIIWYFFGVELYHRPSFLYSIYSKETKKALNINESPFRRINKSFKEAKASLKDLLLNRVRIKDGEHYKEINQAIKRINYFLGLNHDEYTFLKKTYRFLPTFLAFPLRNKIHEIDLNANKNSRIILGNSRSPSNNHFDILKIIKESNYNIPIIIPISYVGGKERYIEKLKETLKNFSNPIDLMEEFVPYEDYVRILANSSTTVFNSHRQMALGNILISLVNGVKVYLSKKNPSYKWLKEKGFHIYSVEQNFKTDLKDNNLALPIEYGIYNRNLYNDLIDPGHNLIYLQNLEEIAKAR